MGQGALCFAKCLLDGCENEFDGREGFQVVKFFVVALVQFKVG